MAKAQAKRDYHAQFTAEIRTVIKSKTNLTALGNANRSTRDLVVDLINDSELSWQVIADGSFLATPTIKRLAQDVTKYPRSDTMDRILRFFNVSLTGDIVPVETKYMNKPKSDSKEAKNRRKKKKK